MTLDELKTAVTYNPHTGIFRWKVRHGKMRPGSVVGCAHSGGYRMAMINGERVFLHRIAWQYIHGILPDCQIDHINGDRADNRIDNLRLANQQQNSGNMKIRKNNKAGRKGVVIDGRNGAIRAYIHVNYKSHYLGTFKTVDEAHSAYLVAAQQNFSEFARAE